MCIDVIKDMYDKAINRVTTIGGRLNCSQSSFSYLRIGIKFLSFVNRY